MNAAPLLSVPGREVTCKVLKLMSRTEITVQGFHSTFRDRTGEQTNYAREIIEHAEMHGTESTPFVAPSSRF